jgi:hypothetical protein
MMDYQELVVRTVDEAKGRLSYLVPARPAAIERFRQTFPREHLSELVGFWMRFGYGQLRASLDGKETTTLTNMLMSPGQVLKAAQRSAGQTQMLPFFIWEDDEHLGIRLSGEKAGAICFMDEVMTGVADTFEGFMAALAKNPRFYLDKAIELEAQSGSGNPSSEIGRRE